MSTDTINNWTDAYVALKRRAEAMRGFIELDPDTPDRERWPRTTGADVLAIAAALDPHVRRLRSSYGVHGVHRRWRTCLDDVGRFALGALGETYPENRALWKCLAAIFVHLSSVEAPPPEPAMWDVLMAELGHVLALRNIGPKGDGPFKQFKVKTFHELYLEQYKHLRDTRGSDRMKPEPGMPGSEMPIPRSTNSDVILLADYWSKQLDGVKEVHGHDSTVKRWKSALADVDQLARKGDPNAVYPKNNAFWREVANTARQVSVADEAPSTWDMAIESLKDSVKSLPHNISSGVKAVASNVVDFAGDVAHGVGKVANEAGKGLFAGFGTPLLIGGGLLGLFLIARARNRDTREG